jgi:HTH-type transcriptional regulator, sugar sensing transcriptional regulator
MLVNGDEFGNAENNLTSLRSLLDAKEQLIFETLNEHGELTANQLVKLTRIPSSKIYFMLDSLLKKGLLSYHQAKRHKLYKAVHPNALLTLYDHELSRITREREFLLKYIQKLDSVRKSTSTYLDINIYEGVEGIKAYYEKLLRLMTKKDVLYMAGSTRLDSQSLVGFFKYFHEERIKKEVELRVLKKKGLPRFIEDFSSTQVKYISNKAPTTYILFRSSVAIVIPNIQPTLIHIKNAELALSFRTYFDEIWKTH